MNEHLSHSTAVTLTPGRAGLLAGVKNTVDVLLRVQAPDAPPGHADRRPPQAIALVLDASGSMNGRPIVEARRCAEYLVSRLRPTDTVSLVRFDHRVQRLWPAVPVGDGKAVRMAIASVQCGGSTDLFGGWSDGADSLVNVPGTGLKRVILLSDGQANAGITETPKIAGHCAAWAAKGVSTSTYGLGNSFNEDLMVAMARAGGGNHYYGDTADDLKEPFQQELDLLGNLCLRELRLSASVPDGISLLMVNELPASDGRWRLPDLAWGAEAWAMFRLSVPQGALPPAGELLSLLRVSVQGLSLEGVSVQMERTGLALPVLNAAHFNRLAEDELVSRRRVELAAAIALLAIRRAAAVGNWEAVDFQLGAASSQFAGNVWVGEILDVMKTIASQRLGDRMMKEAMYSSSQLRFRLAEKDEAMPLMEFDSNDQASYLRRKPSQGKSGV